MNYLCYPVPLIYAAATLATLTGAAVMIRTAAQRSLTALCIFWVLHFSTLKIIASCPENRCRMILEPLMIQTILLLAFVRRFFSGCLAAQGRPAELPSS